MKKIMFLLACLVGFVSLTSFKNGDGIDGEVEALVDNHKQFLLNKSSREDSLLKRFNSENLYNIITEKYNSEYNLRFAHFVDTISLWNFVPNSYKKGWDKEDFLYCCWSKGLIGDLDLYSISFVDDCFNEFRAIIENIAKGEKSMKNWVFTYDKMKMEDTNGYFMLCRDIYKKIYPTYLKLCKEECFFPNIAINTNKKDIEEFGCNDYNCLVNLSVLFYAASKELGSCQYSRTDLVNAFSLFERIRFGAPYFSI